MVQACKCSILETKNGRTVNWRPVLVTCLDCLGRLKEGQNQEVKDEWREERIGMQTMKSLIQGHPHQMLPNCPYSAVVGHTLQPVLLPEQKG